MTYLRSLSQHSPSISTLFTTKLKTQVAAVAAVFLAALTGLAQDPSQPGNEQGSPPVQAQAETVTIPAGTRVALVLTHPVQSRILRRGDDIYAQVTSPVNAGNQTVIPPGTFVQGTVEKLEQHDGRGQLHLQSMTITFPDGYATPIPGPITLLSDEGYALKDPGKGRVMSAVALPLAGAGIGAAIGHSVANTTPQTITNTLPPGCVGPPPGCLSASMTVPRSAGPATVIGAGVGGVVGTVASLVLIFSSHNFYLDAGAPVDMVLSQPVVFQQNEVTQAVRQSAQHTIAAEAVAPRPVPPQMPDTPVDHGTCTTPEIPGTPPTVIPGTPGPDGIPGPPTIIPGTPPTPGTSYPCP